MFHLPTLGDGNSLILHIKSEMRYATGKQPVDFTSFVPAISVVVGLEVRKVGATSVLGGGWAEVEQEGVDREVAVVTEHTSHRRTCDIPLTYEDPTDRKLTHTHIGIRRCGYVW